MLLIADLGELPLDVRVGELCLHDVVATFVRFRQMGGPLLVVGRAALYESLKSSEAADVGELSIVPGNRLYQSPQVWPSDAEYERPIVVRIKIRVSEDEKAFFRLGSELVTHDHVE